MFFEMFTAVVFGQKLGTLYWTDTGGTQSCTCCHRLQIDGWCDPGCHYLQVPSSGCTTFPICSGRCEGSLGAHHYCACPTPSPTPYPTTPSPTESPTESPTPSPSPSPTPSPSSSPTPFPTNSPTPSPTPFPTTPSPTESPTPLPTPFPTTPLPTPSPTTPAPTPSPTPRCQCDLTPGSTCEYGARNTTVWPHTGTCSRKIAIVCDCNTCPSPERALCGDAPSPAAPAQTPWDDFKADLCFGYHFPWCEELMMAFWIGLLLFIPYEFIMVPVRAMKIAYVERMCYCKALWQAFTHQCYCFGIRRHPLSGAVAVAVSVAPWYALTTQRALLDGLGGRRGGEERQNLMHHHRYGSNDMYSTDELMQPGAEDRFPSPSAPPQLVRSSSREVLMLDAASVHIGKKIGEGGMGEVRRGTHEGRPCVFKAAHAAVDDEDFWHEAKLLSELGHPHVVKLFGVVEVQKAEGYGGHTNQLLMVMEYVVPGSIADAFERKEYVPSASWHHHATEIAETVAWLHTQNVIHRDIKPSNVLITTRGDVKLCDVGVSRKQVSVTTSAYHAPSMMTMTMAVGTWPYMPPEIMQDDEARGGGDRSRYDGRASDVYSMAMTFIQMWTCAALYPPEIGAVQLLRRVPEGLRPSLPPNVPRWLVVLLEQMHAGKPRDRPTAREVADALNSAEMRHALVGAGFTCDTHY